MFACFGTAIRSENNPRNSFVSPLFIARSKPYKHSGHPHQFRESATAQLLLPSPFTLFGRCPLSGGSFSASGRKFIRPHNHTEKDGRTEGEGRRGKEVPNYRSIFPRTGNCYLSHLFGFLKSLGQFLWKPNQWESSRVGLRNRGRLEANNGPGATIAANVWSVGRGRMNGRGEIPLFHAN